MRPYLLVRVGEVEWARLAAPEPLGARAWILGVVAVRLTVESGQVLAQLRAHTTGGAEARVRPLSSGERVHVSLLEGSAAVAVPTLTPPLLAEGTGASAAARLALYLDGAPVDAAELAASALELQPAPRGFGHVFCRWLRDGGAEPGFDLTEIVSSPPGAPYPRRQSRPLSVPATVSFAFTSAAARR